VCDKTCIFFFFPIINKYFLMAKRSLLSRCPSYVYSIKCQYFNFWAWNTETKKHECCHVPQHHSRFTIHDNVPL